MVRTAKLPPSKDEIRSVEGPDASRGGAEGTAPTTILTLRSVSFQGVRSPSLISLATAYYRRGGADYHRKPDLRNPLSMTDLTDACACIDFHHLPRQSRRDFHGAHDRDPGDAQQRRIRIPLAGAAVHSLEVA